MKQRRPLLLLLALLALVGALWSYMLIALPPQQTLDQRVHDVGEQLKCPVCQHESVADSSASIAEQMRLVIRQQLQEGKSEQQVLQYFAAHYGNDILLTPPQQGFNLLAWLMPVAMLLIGLGLVALVARDWRAQGRLQLATDAAQADVEPQIDPELEPYLQQLQQELADEDPSMEIK
ncbi:MAG TPA: cytochrome c-type biogenesis protein [Ktedonobacteraceae bacterium]